MGGAEAGAAQLVRVLEREYRTRIRGLVPYFEHPAKAVYRADRTDGPPWVVRAFSPARPPERVEGDAAVLRFLADHGIPAERHVPAADGRWVAAWADRSVLVTEHVPGRPLGADPEALRRLGAVIGRLHALPPAPACDPLLWRRAGSLPREDLAAGRAWLERAPSSPARQALGAALDAASDCEALPRSLIHSDCQPANVVVTPDGDPVLIDWEGAGQGPRVAMLGLALFSCSVQGEAPFAPACVDALVEGYGRHAQPTAEELARLPDAVRFRPAVLAARSLGRDGRLGRLTRYEEAEAVAARACDAFTRYLR